MKVWPSWTSRSELILLLIYGLVARREVQHLQQATLVESSRKGVVRRRHTRCSDPFFWTPINSSIPSFSWTILKQNLSAPKKETEVYLSAKWYKRAGKSAGRTHFKQTPPISAGPNTPLHLPLQNPPDVLHPLQRPLQSPNNARVPGLDECLHGFVAEIDELQGQERTEEPFVEELIAGWGERRGEEGGEGQAGSRG